MPRVGSSKMSTSRLQRRATWRGPPSAGCRRRGSARHWAVDWRLMRSGVDEVVGRCGLAAASGAGRARRPAASSVSGDVLARGHVQHQALGLAVLGEQADARLRPRPAGDADAYRLSVDRRPTRRRCRRRRWRAWPRCGPEPTSPATPRISPRADAKRDGATVARGRRGLDASSAPRPASRRRRGVSPPQCIAPDHQLIDLGDRDLGDARGWRPRRPLRSTVTRSPISNISCEVVGDDRGRRCPARVGGSMISKRRSTSRGRQRRGRLVEDEDPRCRSESARAISTSCIWAMPSSSTRRAWAATSRPTSPSSCSRAPLRSSLRSSSAPRAPAGARRRGSPATRQIGQQVELLVDDPDAGPQGILRESAARDGAPFEQHLAAVGGMRRPQRTFTRLDLPAPFSPDEGSGPRPRRMSRLDPIERHDSRKLLGRCPGRR